MKPTILYLIGTPYCGSTILGAVLGQHPQIENVGELGYLTHRKKDPSVSPCACGKTLRECEFWSKVREIWLTNAGISDETDYRRLQDKYERPNLLFFLQRKSLMKRADFREYAHITRHLVDAVVEVSGKNIIFDTTKSPWRAVALSAMGLNIIPIHLVRSGPRFISSSIRRRLRRRQSKNPHDPVYITQTSLRWLITNLAGEIISKAIQPKPARILYEQLVERPRETIEEIGGMIDIDLDSLAEKTAAGEMVGFDHSIFGSFIRLMGPAALQASDEAPLSPRIDRIFRFVAGWLAKRYGY